MPQADLFYSPDIRLDAAPLLAEIEAVISEHDPAAGECKGRVFAMQDAHHSHVLLRLALLEKPHRDAAFMKALQDKLETLLRPHLPSPCALGIELRFLSPHYLTAKL